ncbi:MAG: DNA mismatch repair endonuclease MutL [Chloroflexia bacterium]|nr:DNA mismatch repair endonuclease MutL [Chloroflexia bacterium]
MTIQRLTDETIGKIAAGEVIERPAAVVKELIENALDAGARRIDVSLVDGGGSEIAVRDDGAGIAFDDLQMAVERHATSKITSATDLGSLRTLGFRGEALSSLAAVSHLQIRSIATDASTGGLLDARFGAVKTAEPVGWGGGTAVVARDLFENVPARRKFLRQPSTESGYVSRIVTAYALAYPEVAISLTVDGRRFFGTDGGGDRISAAVAVWGSASAESIVELESAVDVPDGASIAGIVSLPTLDRSNRQQQYIFVQGRLVTSRALSTAFEQAYSTLLMVGRHPIGCLLVTVPPDQVDVNVHPTKSEVRFEQERFVFSMVQRATRNTLLAHTSSQTIPAIISSPLAEMPPSSSVQRRLTLAHPERLPISSHVAFESPARSGHETGGRNLPVLRVLGQVAGTYLIAEGPDGMYLIDQHAAHERIVFEQLMAEYESRSPDAQLLLNPATVELSGDLYEMYGQCRDELLGFGFDIEDFGASTVLVRSVPAKLKVRDAAETLRIILLELTEGGRGTSRLESLAISAACHTSIRAGQALSLLEMRELVMQLERCSSPQACGHGRPTMIRMTSEELERQFSRR